MDITRREFGAIAAGLAASSVPGAGCRVAGQSGAGNARLTARPKDSPTVAARGTQPLGLESLRDGVLQIPNKTASRIPLLVLFHGAGGSGGGLQRRFASMAAELGVAVLAPDARGSTWDAIGGSFGPDVAFLNRALAHVFDRVAIDPGRIVAAGFSDGATYALSIGLVNGDLFRHILAFSPGFVTDGPPSGTPRVFISHGTADAILPIDRCSRRIVPALRQRGYDVTFREFDGGHEMPPDIAREALAAAVA